MTPETTACSAALKGRLKRWLEENGTRHWAVTFCIFSSGLQVPHTVTFKKKEKNRKRKHYDKEISNLIFSKKGDWRLWSPSSTKVLRGDVSVHEKSRISIRNYAETQIFHSQTLSCCVCILISHSWQYFCIRHMDSTRSFSMTQYLRAKCHEHLRVFYTWNAIFGSTEWLNFASNVSNTEKNKWQF